MRTRSLGILGIALVCLLLGSALAGAESDWEIFRHPDLGFSLSYPSGWVATPGDVEKLPLVIVIGPQAAGVPDVKMAVIVLGLPAPAYVTAETLVSAFDRPMEQQFGKIEVLRVDRTRVDGVPIAVVYFTARDKGQYGVGLFTITRTRLYAVVGATALSSTNLAEEALLLQRILLTFRS